MKVRNRGEDNTWSFSNECTEITAYDIQEQNGVCQFGAENRPNNCGKRAFFDFSTAETVPMIQGMWDLESAVDQWTGDNAF